MHHSTEDLELSAAARALFAKASTAELMMPVARKKSAVSGAARYELREPLAQGTFGVVHEALDRTTGELVALKVLHPTTEPQAIARFEREASAARRLDHPAIVRLLDVGTIESMPFIAFELVRGRSLFVHVEERGPLSERDAIALVRRLAEAVGHAHDRGVVHRDVSPSNVLLGEKGPVLADFGLAKDLLAATALTRTGDVLGTLRFMAPEVLEGKANQADERADLFGLGAVLHFAVTGQPPFRARSVSELGEEMHRGYVAPATMGPRVRAVAERLLATDPAERPRTAAEVVALCDSGLTTPSAPRVSVPPAPKPPAPKPPAPRPPAPAKPPANRRALLVAGAVALLVAIVAVALALRPRDRRAEALAIVADADSRTPLEEQTAAARALALVPDLEEAYALRALGAAHAGDLARAEEDLARAGTGELARRARAWTLFRSNRVPDALKLVAGTRDEARLRWSAGEPGAPLVEVASAPRFIGEAALRRGDLATARRELERAVEPGTLDGCEALLLLARVEHATLDDDAARRDVTRALAAPPREAALARALDAKLARIDAGEAVGEDAVDAALALAAREAAREELERHRLTRATGDLARAAKRLARAASLAPADPSARALLARALARQASAAKDRLRALVPSLPPLAAAHALYVLGDVGGAEIALGRAADPGPREAARLADLRIVIARDVEGACARFHLDATSRGDAMAALSALEKLLHDDPASALEELEFLEKGRASLELAQARCAHDPAGSLAALAHAWPSPPTGEALVLADVLAAAFERKDVRTLLAARGVAADDARRAAELVGPDRGRLAELRGEPTLDAVAAAIAKREVDPLRLYRDERLVGLRSEPRWADLVREAER